MSGTFSSRSTETSPDTPPLTSPPPGLRGKKRPAVLVYPDAYARTVNTLVVSEVTKDLTMASDPACLFIHTSTPEGRATGLIRDSVVSCLVLVKVYADTVVQGLETRTPTLKQKLDARLRAPLALP